MYIHYTARFKSAAIAALVLFAVLVAHQAYGAYLDVSARAAVVMDADTGEVIIAKNMNRRLPPASTTKVMTAILALEKLDLSDNIRVSSFAACKEPTKVNLKCGDVVTVEALMYSMLMKSANDSATVLAEGMAGTEKNFAKLMTKKAAEIGAKNTVFKTASGLPAKGQYTTAYDLATIMRYALGVPGFVEIASTRYATLHLGEKCSMELKNSNKLLWIYDGAVAGKTGYTRSARDCYVGEAESGGRRLIVAILGSEVRWGEAVKLLDLGFEMASKGDTVIIDEPKSGPAKKRRAASRSRRDLRANR
jgi:serine-type D-Ala-D-Ala carboxypeptidase (penicillin-binding protein 5/6)